MLKISIRDEAVKTALRELQNRAGRIGAGLRQKASRLTLAVLAEAKSKTPIDEGTLRRSGSYSVATRGVGLIAKVNFGGQASAYAARQHETDSYTHTRAEWAAKYGRRAASNLKTRNVTVFQKRTPRKALKVTGHKGGQAHWLYGRPSSAWTTRRQTAFMAAMRDEAVRLLTGGK